MHKSAQKNRRTHSRELWIRHIHLVDQENNTLRYCRPKPRHGGRRAKTCSFPRPPIRSSFDKSTSSKLNSDSVHLFTKRRPFFGGKSIIGRQAPQCFSHGAQQHQPSHPTPPNCSPFQLPPPRPTPLPAGRHRTNTVAINRAQLLMFPARPHTRSVTSSFSKIRRLTLQLS